MAVTQAIPITRHPYADGSYKKMLIDGKWVDAASGKKFETHNPATGELLATVAEGDAEDINRAVAAARRAFEGPWSKVKPFERQALLKLRAVAGDPELGRAVEAARDDFCWCAEPWDRADALHLRERQARRLGIGAQDDVYAPVALASPERGEDHAHGVRLRHVLDAATDEERLEHAHGAGQLGERQHAET